MDVPEHTRIDRWIWAVRLYKTRSAAAAACDGGLVRVNGNVVKPAAKVRVGDRVEARVGQWQREVEVLRVIEARVGPAIAAACVVDHSGPPPTHEQVFPVLRRDPGTGRPTKRDRRQVDRLRGGGGG
jgi:ribosome-associated heat shock protein Hsp15